MPELPEVEIIKRQLVPFLAGKTIQTIEIRLPRSVKGDSSVLLGQTIQTVRRISKLLIIDVSGGYSFTVHLKMTGRLISETGNNSAMWDIPYETHLHTRAIITFTNANRLYFHDQRTFGYIEVLKSSDVASLPYIQSLGPEFLSDMTKKQFLNIITKSSRNIKTLLLDQHKMAGIGNIYANEALWLAKIHPEQFGTSLTKEEGELLFTSLEEVLSIGIKNGGASRDNYRDAFGNKGTMQNHFQVYNRQKQPCKRCGTEILKYQLGGRGTYMCPLCQNKKKRVQ